MIKRTEFYQLLTDTMGHVPVYPDYVPADAALPAVSYLHLAEQDGDRPLEGGRDLRGDTWQVEVLAATRDEVDQLIATLGAVDNTTTAVFQRIMVLNQRDDPATPDTSYRRGFIDIATTNRSVN